MSIEHEVSAKFSSSKLYMFPNRGKGLVAGSTVRDLLSLAGLKNVTAKLNSGSKNKLNNARVAYLALSKLGSKIKPTEIEDIILEDSVDIKALTKEEELL
jgi:ribosomal protein S5